VLQYGDSPFAVTVYGAGVIGCEYASIFINLGCKVTLVNTHERLLSYLDEEIAEALSYHLREQGCVIRHNEKFAGIETRDNDVVLQLESGRRIKSDVLLWANGRTGNTDNMNLGALGIGPDGRGQLRVNEHYQTAAATSTRRATSAGRRRSRAPRRQGSRRAASSTRRSRPPPRPGAEQHLYAAGDQLGRALEPAAAAGAHEVGHANLRAWRARQTVSRSAC
jgi:NADPH-dependent 2,4-dienoyl-CoA reductase/sulfur reductase-like enzyme